MKKSAILSKGVLSLLITCFSTLTYAESTNEKPLIVIGSSYANGNTQINGFNTTSLGSSTVESGSYLSLGDALVQAGKLVINEARAGSTTFANGTLPSYRTQFENALNRVAIRDTHDPVNVLGYNADYVIIDVPSDCVHSGVSNMSQFENPPCSEDDINASVDRVIELARYALSLGITPVISGFPRYERLDLNLFQQTFSLSWVADNHQYNKISNTFRNRLAVLTNSVEVVGANPWGGMNHLGDGYHPNSTSATNAAESIMGSIRVHKIQLERKLEADRLAENNMESVNGVLLTRLGNGLFLDEQGNLVRVINNSSGGVIIRPVVELDPVKIVGIGQRCGFTDRKGRNRECDSNARCVGKTDNRRAFCVANPRSPVIPN